jgi:hypothetical protein
MHACSGKLRVVNWFHGWFQCMIRMSRRSCETLRGEMCKACLQRMFRKGEQSAAQLTSLGAMHTCAGLRCSPRRPSGHAHLVYGSPMCARPFDLCNSCEASTYPYNKGGPFKTASRKCYHEPATPHCDYTGWSCYFFIGDRFLKVSIRKFRYVQRSHRHLS